MSTPYEATGRTEQKRRTRDALVGAARQLVASGVTPTVEQGAAAAGISRTAAYRYFPNQRALLIEAHPETGARSLLPADPPADPAARLAAVIRAFTHLIVETEAQRVAEDELLQADASAEAQAGEAGHGARDKTERRPASSGVTPSPSAARVRIRNSNSLRPLARAWAVVEGL